MECGTYLVISKWNYLNATLAKDMWNRCLVIFTWVCAVTSYDCVVSYNFGDDRARVQLSPFVLNIDQQMHLILTIRLQNARNKLK